MDEPNHILACPFCGCEDTALTASMNEWWVSCVKFFAHAKAEPDRAAAKVAWNRRAGAGRTSHNSGGKQLCSSAWLDALAERLERRVDRFNECRHVIPLDGSECFRMIMAILTEELRASAESASNAAGELPREK